MQKERETNRLILVCSAIICLGLVALLTGCQTLAERQRSSQLQEVLRKYEGVIRWGSIDQARRFFKPGEAEGVIAAPTQAMRVTHYEVVQGPTMVDEDRAIQTAVIQYVFVESQVVRELVDQQTWQYDPGEESWYLVSPVPEFK